MTTYIESLVDQLVLVITNEGRVFTGVLKSFDQSMNMFLGDCFEKVYSLDEGVNFIKMGLYMIRGDNVSLISEVDELLEKQVDYSQIMAEPIKEMNWH
jgi:U6 snRNA-associated Sm-like protein LSm8